VSPYAPLYHTSPYGDSANSASGGGGSTGAASRSGTTVDRAAWQTAGACGAVLGALKRVQWPSSEEALPPEAARLLSLHACFVLEGSRLWPSALDRFGDGE